MLPISANWAGGPLSVNLRTRGYTYLARSGQMAKGSGFDAAVVRDWLRQSGVEVAATDVGAEIAALAGIVPGGNPSAIPNPGAFASISKSSSGTYTSPGCGPVPLLGFWLVVWFIGLWFCVRRRKNAAAAVTTEAAASSK
jgi:hypothetical protein